MEEIVVNFIKSFGPGATVALGLFFIFASADGYVSKEFRAFLSGHLKRLKAPKKHNRWPDTFLMMFRKLFGKKVFSGKFFFRSCTASFLGIIIMVAVWGLLDPKTFSSFIEEQIAPGGQFSWNILYLFLTPVFFNFFPDYISLAESQCVIAMMRGRNIGGIFLLILADVLFTFAIFWGSFILLYALIILASIFINFKFQLGFEGVINYFFENLIGYIRLTINEFIKPKTFLLQSEKGNLAFFSTAPFSLRFGFGSMRLLSV